MTTDETTIEELIKSGNQARFGKKVIRCEESTETVPFTPLQ